MRIPITLTAIATAALLLIEGDGAFAQVQRDEAACAALSKLQVPGVALSDVKAQWFPAGSPPPPEPPFVPPLAVKLPAYCRLDGDARSAHRRGRQDLRHRLRPRAACRLERAHSCFRAAAG